ncbi:MAG: hypothetical protein L6V95_07530 [Candidatus Melainabacteria bacterium]|nr:MAG: hypothetical protein L6V95_07530 [Candidatus Melainabacteria bacterium]
MKNRLFKVAVVLTLSANLLNQNVFAASSDIFETDKLVDLITLSSFIDYTSIRLKIMQQTKMPLRNLNLLVKNLHNQT